MTIIRTSRDLVRQTRLQRGENARQFAEWIGVRRQRVQQVEEGGHAFDADRVAAGLSHPDPELRAFWHDYEAMRHREQTYATIQYALTMCQSAQEAVSQ